MRGIQKGDVDFLLGRLVFAGLPVCLCGDITDDFVHLRLEVACTCGVVAIIVAIEETVVAFVVAEVAGVDKILLRLGGECVISTGIRLAPNIPDADLLLFCRCGGPVGLRALDLRRVRFSELQYAFDFLVLWLQIQFLVDTLLQLLGHLGYGLAELLNLLVLLGQLAQVAGVGAELAQVAGVGVELAEVTGVVAEIIAAGVQVFQKGGHFVLF